MVMTGTLIRTVMGYAIGLDRFGGVYSRIRCSTTGTFPFLFLSSVPVPVDLVNGRSDEGDDGKEAGG